VQIVSANGTRSRRAPDVGPRAKAQSPKPKAQSLKPNA
jgi:hypothetical protein